MISLADKLADLTHLGPFGQRSENPLTNLKTATRWIDSLAFGEVHTPQQAILHELARFNENSTPLTKDRLAVLMLLDERSHDLQDTLVGQYLRNPRMSRAAENQLWHAVYGLYWEVARGYHKAALQLADEVRHHQELAPLVTVRAIRAFGRLLKWRAIRYLPAGNKLWLHLHKLYRSAEAQGFHRLPQRAYVEDASDCSCEAAYLHILMLDLANSGTLYPKQLDLIDRWLCNWHGMLHLAEQPAASEHSFCVDLSADHGGRRLRKAEAAKRLRFWTTDALVQQLHVLHTALHEGFLPEQLGLTEAARPAEDIELLEHVERQWSSLARREQRRAPRKAIKRLVDVAHGLDSLIAQMKTAGTHASVPSCESCRSSSEIDDLQVYGFVTERTHERASQTKKPSSFDAPDVERWVMQNESEYGYGAIVESRAKDWLRVGALIGIKPHDGHEWKIGVVRRLSRLGEATTSVGIETLAEKPVPAMLHDPTPPGYTVNGFDSSGASLPHASLWLAGSLIIDPVLFMPGKLFEIHGIPEHGLIALGSPLERSEGWIRIAVDPMDD